ncbi:MAG TPA: amino acid ABC transporter substrate-binding protein [Anaerolineae bacterium]|nr:amino acid ABC transporter substrate-binding protein [Anaerolineae bacterium]HID85230.1 amino acid ABC transporter substrate-binding protein [Anaerolineales bacterium]HIQ09072.1 amino acid ABC transporter substrate-binding protein [Anaerolineaceae bacterium]
MKKVLGLLAVLVVLALALAACGGQSAAPAESGAQPVQTVIVTVQVPAEGGAAAPSGYGETLKTVKERGNVICGVNGQLPGFSYVNAQGEYEGFDVDFCQALAAAIFGDPAKVEYRPLTAKERFTALQTGEIDVLIRNTTWTLSRDTELGANFVATTFYDGQGIMVSKDSGVTKLEDLNGASICVATGTTTELNLADQMSARGIDYTPVVFETADQVFGAYEEGRCDAVTTDKSGLISRKITLKNPDAHIILDETLSKEPLGPVVRHGDDQWFDIVQWVVFATFTGEEFGITSQNVDEVKATTQDPNVKKFLGLEGEMGQKLGLDNNWAYNIIKMVGNYAEIYDRNLGPGTPFNLPRGLNASWKDGGLIYAPPIR